MHACNSCILICWEHVLKRTSQGPSRAKGLDSPAMPHAYCKSLGRNILITRVAAQVLRRQHAEVAEQGFTEYKTAQVVKRCTSCGHGLELISGCDHVT